ncbi:MAG TPA: hypothetical protein VL225_09660 [Vicinamibacterales bacterium]|nr:hypothetical protein [Vicinamibacterales bacterium]
MTAYLFHGRVPAILRVVWIPAATLGGYWLAPIRVDHEVIYLNDR